MRWATNDTEGSSRVVRNCFLCVRTWYFAEFYLRATFSCARRQIVSYDNSRRMERSEHNSDSNCASRWNKKMRRKEISRKTKFQLHINIDFAKWKTWRPKRILKLFLSTLHSTFETFRAQLSHASRSSSARRGRRKSMHFIVFGPSHFRYTKDGRDSSSLCCQSSDILCVLLFHKARIPLSWECLWKYFETEHNCVVNWILRFSIELRCTRN